MSANGPFLVVDRLTLSFRSPDGMVRALDEVSFAVDRTEIMGFVGESGSGKSVTALAILGLLPRGVAVVEHGRILYQGRDLLRASSRELERVRGKAVSMVFQSPGGSLNPLLRVGSQIEEVIRIHRGLDRQMARGEAKSLLERVGLPGSAMRSYPHELSGGMQQRACIAIAVSCHPDLLIADEPTSSLDVSIQAQILDLLRDLRQAGLIRAIIFITHDFGLIDLLCDRVTVLYAGQVVETGRTVDVLGQPKHPYTRGLLAAIPRLEHRNEYLGYIRGTVPNLVQPPLGCRFHPRCPERMEVCPTVRPSVTALASGRSVCCHLFDAEVARAR